MTEDTTLTVGKAALDAMAQDVQTDAIEMQREMQKGTSSEKSFEEEVWECVERGKKDSSMPQIFYVVVLHKKERLLHNVVRNYFFYRASCPTPEYDQIVYRVNKKDDEITFIWVIPNLEICCTLPFYKHQLPESQHWLLTMIEEFNSGKLDKICCELNNELHKGKAVIKNLVVT